MPTNITEVATWSTPSPVPNDGEGATRASLLQFAQVFANRTAYLKAIFAAGVTRVRLVADITALKALGSLTTGDCAIVFGTGLYTFDSTTTPGSDTSPWIIKPGTGSGQWVHDFSLTRAGVQTAGFAPVFMDQAAIGAGTASTSSTSLTDAAGWSVDLPSLEVSDKVFIDVDFGAYSSIGSATTTVQPIVVDDVGGVATGSAHTEAAVTTVATSTVPFHRGFIHVVTAAGTSRIKLQFKSDTGTASVVGKGLIRYVVYRYTSA